LCAKRKVGRKGGEKLPTERAAWNLTRKTWNRRRRKKMKKGPRQKETSQPKACGDGKRPRLGARGEKPPHAA